ncbi:60S ribosomal protein L16, mitochondrial [Impatiens glandulifera]|uniref:60S ribosomal protein L16, mitochondrial n=1 Tax=Impatiens glandulifera TaxID=253017 RepID=UPI001FB0B46A|nr:60S ribosomal protein L16, mitochondrial [Impatiens glandulifera]
MSGQFRRNSKIWVRVLADLPITGKPTEVRMGRGKGNPTGWIARVSTGQILFEMDGVSLSNARQAATLAAHKPCSSTNGKIYLKAERQIASLKLGQGKQERALKTNSQAKGGREGTDSILKSNRALLSEEGSELGSGTCLHE